MTSIKYKSIVGIANVSHGVSMLVRKMVVNIFEWAARVAINQKIPNYTSLTMPQKQPCRL
jgi:hypothetical protein